MNHTRMRQNIHTINVGSANFPSGLMWLLNILLELDFRVESKVDHYWDIDATGVARLTDFPPVNISLRSRLPILARTTEFRFTGPTTFLWGHAWPTAFTPSLPTLCFIRNPMDAIYSNYKRENSSLSFRDFLARPHAFPEEPQRFCPRLSQPDLWGLYHLLWVRLYPGHLPLYFEQMKQDPVRDVERLIAFAGGQRSPERLRQAIANSSVDKAQQVEQHLNARMGQVAAGYTVNRRGKAHEWREVLGPSELACFSGLAAYVMGLHPAYANLLPTPPAYEHDWSAAPALRDAYDRGVDAGMAGELERCLSMMREVIARLPPQADDCTPATIVQLGRLLTSADWCIRLATPEHRSNTAKIFATLLEASDYLINATLYHVCIARALADYGLSRHAELVLHARLDGAGYFEQKEAGLFLLEIHPQLARKVLLRASRLAPTKDERFILAKELVKGWHVNIARLVLAAGGDASAFVTLLHYAWRRARMQPALLLSARWRRNASTRP